MNNYDLVRPLLDKVPAMRDALAAYDAAVTARAEHRPPPDGGRRQRAQAELRAEHDAAAEEGRAPRLGVATLRFADEAAIDDQDRGDALDRLVGRRMAALDAAIASNGAHIWHVVANARAEALRKAPALDPVPAALAALWGQLRLPALAWVPAVVNQRRLQRWDIPAMRATGVLGAQLPGALVALADVRQRWDEHLWEQVALAEGRGWRLDPDGSLRLLTPWPSDARMRPALADDPAYSPPNVQRIGLGGEPRREGLTDGDLVWVGTGPNGERGADADDVTGGLQSAGMTW